MTPPDGPGLLLVEADDELLRVAPPFMRRVGSIHVCRDIPSALGFLDQNHVHVLIIANRMLEQRAKEMLELLRRRQPCAQVMVLCEQAAMEVKTSVLAEGIGDVLVKPFDIAQLPLRITRLLDLMREQQRRVALERELNARIQHHDRIALLGTLAATVAHDVANPLSVIVTNAGLSAEVLDKSLAMNGKDRELLHEAAIETLQSANTINSYLSHVLRFSRVETAESWDDDLSETLRMSLLFVRSRARNTATIVHAPPFRAVPRISHHPASLAQAIVNALTNAIDAAGPRGNVWLFVKESASDVQIFVRNEGPQLSEQEIHRLGEAFFTTKVNGTGLGTAVMQQVMNEHGGSVDWRNLEYAPIDAESKGSKNVDSNSTKPGRTRRERSGVEVCMRVPKHPSSIPPEKRFLSR